MDGRRQPPPHVSHLLALWMIGLLLVSACGGSADDAEPVAAETAPARSSGELAFAADDDAGGIDGPTTTPTTTDASAQPSVGAGGQSDQASTGSFVAEVRPDGIELVFADGALGPAELGTTIDEIAAALGPDYEITPEESIRVDFPSGYSVANDGEVLFWAVEEEGLITLFMTVSPRVGLDSGLRPKLALSEAVELHGEPTLTLGPESREFAGFADGTGSDSAISVLVAIGQFGGPVGNYDETGYELGSKTAAYQPEEANIKELWFHAR